MERTVSTGDGMSTFSELYRRFLSVFDDPGVRIPACGLKFVKHEESDPIDQFRGSRRWLEAFPRSLASCGYSYKAAKGGWTLRVGKATIGCPAGAISLGLVGRDASDTFDGGCYVKPMERAATPNDFSEGFVYAPHQSGHPEFALFGDSDCGRYETLDAARKAIGAMPVIPPVMTAVYYYHPLLSEVDVTPDLVHLYCTPLEAMRLIQGYAYPTGERFTMSCIGIRGVSCDMTSWPYMRQELNGTFLCLGARGITGWEEQYIGFGMPFHIFAEIVEGMEKSKGGFPYAIFPRFDRGRSPAEIEG
jgi:uncharacterized protein (DUF169 family)